MGKIIGIDLGTTNSLATVWENGGSQLIPNTFGEYLTPSVVSFDADGTVYVGKVAKERLVTHPDDTASVFKRFMGTSKTYQLAGRKYKPEELSALVLRRLKEDAEEYLGETVEEAVISVPAYFNDLARNATKNAGKLAGLRVDRIINEPSAAALSYQHWSKLEEATLLVFDFGGGTLDVSLVDCFDNIVEILAVGGDNHLGGSDFDRAIADAFYKECDLTEDDLTMEECAIVEERAMLCKQELTEHETTTMRVELRGQEYRMELSRLKLIEISEFLFAQMNKPIRRVLMDAEKTMKEVDAVVLVGGSCKMPIVQKFLSHTLGRVDVSVVNPDYMIALGVGVYAGIKERNADIKDMMLTDICPFSLGTGVYNEAEPGRGLNEIIIERNTALPASREIVVSTVYNRQTRVEIRVYQGEEMYAEDNLFLGKMELKVPAAPRGEESIAIRYTYDINGILVVDATVLSTHEKKQMVIRNQEIRMNEQEIEAKLKELEKLKIHPREKEENKALMARAERLYCETTGAMREDVEHRTNYFNHLLANQNPYRIQRGRKQFEHFLSYIESYLIKSEKPETSVQSFAEWYADESEKEADRQEWQEEEAAYDTWRNGHLTS